MGGQDIALMQARLEQREQQLLDLERAHHGVCAAEAELQVRVRTLEDYIAELPTNEEYEDRGDALAKAMRKYDP